MDKLGNLLSYLKHYISENVVWCLNLTVHLQSTAWYVVEMSWGTELTRTR